MWFSILRQLHVISPEETDFHAFHTSRTIAYTQHHTYIPNWMRFAIIKFIFYCIHCRIALTIKYTIIWTLSLRFSGFCSIRRNEEDFSKKWETDERKNTSILLRQNRCFRFIRSSLVFMRSRLHSKKKIKWNEMNWKKNEIDFSRCFGSMAIYVLHTCMRHAQSTYILFRLSLMIINYRYQLSISNQFNASLKCNRSATIFICYCCSLRLADWHRCFTLTAVVRIANDYAFVCLVFIRRANEPFPNLYIYAHWRQLGGTEEMTFVEI